MQTITKTTKMAKKEIERIAVLETKTENVEKNIEKIMTNHLPHIQEGIDRLNDKFGEGINKLHDKLDDSLKESEKKITKYKEDSSKEIQDVKYKLAKYAGAFAVIIFIISIVGPIIAKNIFN